MAINYAALKAECQNNPNNYSYTDPQSGTTLTLAQWWAAGADAACAAAMNMATAGFWVYRTSIPVAEVFDAIVWANFTPSDVVPTDTSLNNDIFQSRQIACQTKQMNLQTMIVGQSSISGAKANIRAGLQDALTNIPSGANGATRAAGWTTVRDTVLARLATRAERLYANTGSGNGGTAATAAALTFEGDLTPADIQAARAA